MSAPFGRRLCAVAENQVSGGYRIFSLIDREGPAPEPGQFYMLASEKSWGEGGGRPYLPRAISVAETAPSKDGVRLDFLAELDMQRRNPARHLRADGNKLDRLERAGGQDGLLHVAANDRCGQDTRFRACRQRVAGEQKPGSNCNENNATNDNAAARR